MTNWQFVELTLDESEVGSGKSEVVHGKTFSFNKNGNLVTYRRLGLPAGAQIGLEYDFKIPLNLSVDWRPMINLFGLRQGDFTSNLLNVALGVRYRF